MGLGIFFFVLSSGCIVFGCIFNNSKKFVVTYSFIGIICAVLGTCCIFDEIDSERPTINDVPNKAHIDTTITIKGNDTTYYYEFVWNDTTNVSKR